MCIGCLNLPNLYLGIQAICIILKFATKEAPVLFGVGISDNYLINKSDL